MTDDQTALIFFSRTLLFFRELPVLEGWTQSNFVGFGHILTLRSEINVRILSGFPPQPSLFCHEEDLPTKGSPEKAASRIPSSHAYSRR